jgi:SAM-dependent methyltransferase
MLAGNAATWNALGAADPLWAVLSAEHGRDGGWDEAQFFATGERDAAWLRAVVERAGGSFGGRALDFGCGVGRLSRGLATHAEHVVGVDVAASMIARARAGNPCPERISYLHNVATGLPFADGEFDLAVSLIVLQHLPPPLTLRYLLELARVLRPGGTLAVQLPSEPAAAEPLPAPACRARIEVLAAPDTLGAGEVGLVQARVHNLSGVGWPAGRLLKLGNHWRSAGGELAVRDDGRFDLPAVPAGGSVPARLRVCAPVQPGRYTLELDLVQEFVAWWADNGNPTERHPVQVTPAGPDPTPPDPPAEAATDPARHGAMADPAPAPAAVASRPVGDSAIEIHPIRRDVVCAVLDYAGCRVRHVEPDGLAGPGWLSYTYVAQARQPPR